MDARKQQSLFLSVTHSNIPVPDSGQCKGIQSSTSAARDIWQKATSLTYTFANASVPKVTVITGEGLWYCISDHGKNKAMAQISFYAWPNASIGMMDSKSAAKIMYVDEIAASTMQLL